MAYDETLVQRVRSLLEGKTGFTEKRMFGGVCFLVRGNMACGILNDDLIVRVGPENYEDSLKLPNTREFDITGRSMKGWVMVSTEGHNANESLSSWVERGIAFALTLPAK
jgi:TfoX/Sxy family transcriptional regulator of competence genes